MDELDTALNSAAFSEERLEKFALGEGDLDFRTPFQIQRDSLFLRAAGEDSDDSPQQLRIRGLATTSDTDTNGVTVVPSALRSLPRDFRARSTLLFNHDVGSPIGVIGRAKFIQESEEKSFVEVEAFVNVDARNPKTQMRFVDDIENGTLSKFSFAWSTRDGEMIWREKPTKKTDAEKEDDVLYTYRFGSDHAPEILVHSLEAVELSIVSVPADAGAEFAVRNMRRSLSSIAQRFVWDKDKGIMVPKSVRDISDPTVETEVEETEVETVVADERTIESGVTVEGQPATAWDGFEEELRSIESPERDAWGDIESEITALGGAITRE